MASVRARQSVRRHSSLTILTLLSPSSAHLKNTKPQINKALQLTIFSILLTRIVRRNSFLVTLERSQFQVLTQIFADFLFSFNPSLARRWSLKPDSDLKTNTAELAGLWCVMLHIVPAQSRAHTHYSYMKIGMYFFVCSTHTVEKSQHKNNHGWQWTLACDMCEHSPGSITDSYSTNIACRLKLIDWDFNVNLSLDEMDHKTNNWERN